MTVTFVTNPNESIDDSPKQFFGVSTDTKPTVASHSALPVPTKGATFYETDTGLLYVTYDGTTWVRASSVIRIGRKTVSTTVAMAATTNYAAEDVLSASAGAGTYWTFSDVVQDNGGSGSIVAAICICQTTNVSHRVTLYLYNAAPTSNLNDNAANTAPAWADRAGYLGEINFPALNDRGGATKTQVMPGEGGIPLPFKCGSSVNDIYGILITEDAITSEVAGASYIISLLVDYN